MVSWWQTQPDQNFLNQFFHFSSLLYPPPPPRYFSLVLLSQRHSLKITWCPTLPGLNRGRERRWGCASEFSSLSESRRRRRENRLIFLLLPLAISQMGFHTLPWRNSGLLGPLCWKWLTWPTWYSSLFPPLPSPSPSTAPAALDQLLKLTQLAQQLFSALCFQLWTRLWEDTWMIYSLSSQSSVINPLWILSLSSVARADVGVAGAPSLPNADRPLMLMSATMAAR